MVFSEDGSGSVLVSMASNHKTRKPTSSDIQANLERALRKRIGADDSAAQPAMVSSESVIREFLLAEGAFGDFCVFFPVNDCLLSEPLLIRLPGEGPKIRDDTRLLMQRGICKQLRQFGESLLKPADLEVVLVNGFPAHFLEICEMITFCSTMINVAFAALVASLAHSKPVSAHWLPIGRSRQLHLIHGVLFAEQLTTPATIDVAIGPAQTSSAKRV